MPERPNTADVLRRHPSSDGPSSTHPGGSAPDGPAAVEEALLRLADRLTATRSSLDALVDAVAREADGSAGARPRRRPPEERTRRGSVR